jgi:hypothetical protein
MGVAVSVVHNASIMNGVRVSTWFASQALG